MGAQEDKRREPSAQGRADEGGEGPAGNLDGRGACLGIHGLQAFWADVPGQVAEGSRLPGEGWGDPAGLGGPAVAQARDHIVFLGNTNRQSSSSRAGPAFAG